MTPNDTIRAIEELTLNAWPAPQTVLYDGWILRFASGYTRRANSINPLYPSAIGLAEKIAACERIYRDRGLKVIFKLTAASQPDGLDDALAAAGYAFDALTSVQLLDLGNRVPSPDPGIELTTGVTEEWFAAFCQMSNLASGHRPAAQQILHGIIPAAGFALVRQDRETVACGFAVAQEGRVGFFDVVTDGRYRRRGYGRRLMAGLLDWGRVQGAHTAYLQVMVNNAAALGLYDQLGFREIYRYWYRVKT
jgi:ribosomal protein S18 acetylase RimI-like enzyme